jgi:hypothetical protein
LEEDRSGCGIIIWLCTDRTTDAGHEAILALIDGIKVEIVGDTCSCCSCAVLIDLMRSFHSRRDSAVGVVKLVKRARKWCCDWLMTICGSRRLKHVMESVGVENDF